MTFLRLHQYQNLELEKLYILNWQLPVKIITDVILIIIEQTIVYNINQIIILSNLISTYIYIYIN